MAPLIQFKNVQGLWKTFDKVSKNGIRVVKSVDRTTGEVVTQAFKPGEAAPFKQVLQTVSKKTRVPHHSSNLDSLNVTKKTTKIDEIGKETIDIRTDSYEWFYNGQPNKTYSSGLIVQKGMPDRSWLKFTYNGDTTHKNHISFFENDWVINYKEL